MRLFAVPFKCTAGQDHDWRGLSGSILLQRFSEVQPIHCTGQLDVGHDDVRSEFERKAKAVRRGGRLQRAVTLSTEPLSVHFPFVPGIADEQHPKIAAHAVSFALAKPPHNWVKPVLFG